MTSPGPTRFCCDGLCDQGRKCPLTAKFKRSSSEAFPEEMAIAGYLPPKVKGNWASRLFAALAIALAAASVALVFGGQP